MINLSFDYQENILNVKPLGSINLVDILNGYENLINNKSLPKELKILVDYRETVINISEDELPFIIEKVEILLENFISIKQAIIHDNPKSTAFAMLISLHIKSEKYRLQIFSTIESAKRWLIFN